METITTNFTKTTHRDVYPAIDPARPELSQAGRTVLVTGGGTGIGHAIAESFGTAKASKVIITGRRADVLNKARDELQAHARAASSPTQYVAETVDVTDAKQSLALWDGLAAAGTVVDVLVLNAAKFAEDGLLLDIDIDDLWSHFDTNVKGPLAYAQAFSKQGRDRPKFLINVSTSAINIRNVISDRRPTYSLTKGTATWAMQLIARMIEPEKIQVINFHPGVIFQEMFAKVGITEDMYPFDNPHLPGAFAVWAATQEARFLHGRWVWANWDVTELAQGEIRKAIDTNDDFLRIGVVGVADTNRAWPLE